MTCACLAFAAAAVARASTPPVAPADGEVVELTPVTVEDVIDAMERDGVSAGLNTTSLAGGAAANGSLPTIKSAVSSLPGLIVQDSLGGFDNPRISVRGSGVQSAPVSRGLVWTLDGLPLNGADGSFNSALVEPAFAESIALHRGASDPATGALALGGSLAFATGYTGERPHFSFTAGEDGYVRAVVSAGVRRENITEWFAASLARWDGWRPHSAQQRATIAGCITSYLGEKKPMLFVRFYAANPYIDIPGALTAAAAQNDPASITAQVAADQPRRETDFARTAFELQWGEGALRRVSLEFAAQVTDDWFRQQRATGILKTRGPDFTARVSMRRDIGEHTIHTGASALVGRRDHKRYTNLSGAEGAAFADMDLAAQTMSAWLQDRWKLSPDWIVLSSVSLLSARREIEGTPSAAGTVSTQGVAAQVSVRRRVAYDAWLFCTASRGLEAPTHEDLLNVRGTAPALTLAWTPLRTQRADTIECGVRGSAGAVSFEFTAYAARWRDEFLRLADANGALIGTLNATPTVHRGIESALRWRVLDGARPLDLTLTHTWTLARFDHDPVNGHNRIGGVPPQTGAADISSIAERGWFAVVGASWVKGQTFVDHADRLGYGGNFIARTRVGWKSRDGWTVFVEVDNALDRTYIASSTGVIDVARAPAATAIFLPGSPRTWRAGFERSW